MNQNLLEELARLETEARQLEPDADTRHRLLADADAYAQRFLESLQDLPAFRATTDKGAGIVSLDVRDKGRPLAALLEQLEQHVDRPGLNTASGAMLGYIPGGGLYTSSVADYLAAVVNKFSAVFFPAPGAVRMENLLLDWMGGLIGYPETAAGNLTSGGSIANLIAIVTARDAFQLRGRDLHRSVIYLSEQRHHSIDKGLHIAGLDECMERQVPVDDGYRMRAEALEQMVREDRDMGNNPWLVVATAGTTDTGVVDPLDAIGEICQREKLWYHVDAAYGGFFLLCDEVRDIFRGIERSNSVVMDPHKTLFVPYGSGAVLVRDGATLVKSNAYEASYMQDAQTSREELAPVDLSPEQSRHFRGLRLWLPLLYHGLAPFRASLQEKILLARYFHGRLSELDGFEVGPFPDLSVVTFRYLPESGNADDFNRALVRAIHEDGRVFMSTTVLEGRYTIRMAAGAFRTHREHIDLAIEVLREKVAELEAR